MGVPLGATVPGWAPPAGVLVAGVVAACALFAGAAVAGVVVAPCTRADAGIGSPRAELAWLVVDCVAATAGETATASARRTHATSAHDVAPTRKRLRLARAIIAIAMLTVVAQPLGQAGATHLNARARSAPSQINHASQATPSLRSSSGRGQQILDCHERLFEHALGGLLGVD